MKLIYSRSQQAIVEDKADSRLVLDLSLSGLASSADIERLGLLFAAAPAMLAALEWVFEIEPDDYGDRTLSAEGMDCVHAALARARQGPAGL